MASESQTIWGIHGGKTGDADQLFLKRDVIAIGWQDIGDLSNLKDDRDKFRNRVIEVFEDEVKPGAIPNITGQIYRFVHEMAVGDFILYPSKASRTVHFGQVTGKYEYRPKISTGYPHQRAVKWLNELPRTRFSQGALYEIGSAMSFFQVKNYADEFHAIFTGKKPVSPSSSDETVSQVSADIEQTTRDFILKKLAAELKGHPFADFVAQLLQTMGYRTRVSEEGPDGGIDIVAHNDELGFEPPIIKVQVKSTEGSVGDPLVSALYGKVSANEFGLLVTLGSFTTQAANFARSKSNLRLIDGDELVELILTHYEQFDSRYKGLLPLKRVFIPEAIAEEEE